MKIGLDLRKHETINEQMTLLLSSRLPTHTTHDSHQEGVLVANLLEVRFAQRVKNLLDVILRERCHGVSRLLVKLLENQRTAPLPHSTQTWLSSSSDTFQ